MPPSASQGTQGVQRPGFLPRGAGRSPDWHLLGQGRRHRLGGLPRPAQRTGDVKMALAVTPVVKTVNHVTFPAVTAADARLSKVASTTRVVSGARTIEVGRPRTTEAGATGAF